MPPGCSLCNEEFGAKIGAEASNKEGADAMSAYVAVITRALANCGRESDEIYVHVVTGYQRLGAVASLAEWLANHPDSDWHNPGYVTYVVELSGEAEFNALSASPIYHDNRRNLPCWQQQAGDTGSPKAFGSYSDPTSAASAWNLAVQLDDPRFILRVYDDDPIANPGTAVWIDEEEFDETPAATVTRYIQLFSADDLPLSNNSANQRTEVGGRLMDFDFGSSHAPALSAGVTSFGVDISRTGDVRFGSNHRYRFIGPTTLAHYRAQIFGKILRASLE